MKTAIEILDEYRCPEIPFNEMILMSYPAIINAMEEFANQSKWISVEEIDKLPEQGERVLIYSKDFGVQISWLNIRNLWVFPRGVIEEALQGTITHWQELPTNP